MIVAQDLRKVYGPTLVLDGVSFALAAGQCLALLGPNGAGKTTLLRLLATLQRPTSGALQVGGIDALREPPARTCASGRPCGAVTPPPPVSPSPSPR